MLYQKSRTINSDFLFLKFRVNGLKESRVGFVVSKKISKKAVMRNRVKRQLREAVRIYLAKIDGGFDVVFFAKPNIIGKEFREIENVVASLLEKARLIN